LVSAGSGFSRDYARQIAGQGTYVIDNSSAWRMTADCPLIVPEVNSAAIADARTSRIIANPNCSTIQMVVVLKPLLDAFGLLIVQVATYQSVSGTGQKGISEFESQLAAHVSRQPKVAKVYAQPIIFNVLPAIDVMDEATGHCGEEVKMVRETQRILGQPALSVFASTARVPVINCHSEALTVQLGRAVSRSEICDVLRNAPGLTLVASDRHEDFPTALSATGKPGVYVSRVRTQYGAERSSWMQCWVVADNLKKGAATNAVQILETLAEMGWVNG
jgi:aspartate-semialdehyde dehydrogenase